MHTISVNIVFYLFICTQTELNVLWCLIYCMIKNARIIYMCLNMKLRNKQTFWRFCLKICITVHLPMFKGQYSKNDYTKHKKWFSLILTHFSFLFGPFFAKRHSNELLQILSGYSPYSISDQKISLKKDSCKMFLLYFKRSFFTCGRKINEPIVGQERLLL